MQNRLPVSVFITVFATVFASGVAQAQAVSNCKSESGSGINPVLELYTSEGCSSCPPADAWLSRLKGAMTTANSTGAVVQAFHVGYWDYIGWVDRFASPVHTKRQSMLRDANKLPNLYTPQLLRNGSDWRSWWGTDPATALAPSATPAKAHIQLQRLPDQSVQAKITADVGLRYAAYWTLTEHNLSNKVNAGENKGELLKHDHVVRQYAPVGQYAGSQTLSFAPLVQTGAVQVVNLVLHEVGSAKTVQALRLQCS